MASSERMESLHSSERTELEQTVKTRLLLQRLDILRKESQHRAKTRKDVLQLLTTAAEELDALPEELSYTPHRILGM